MRFSGSRAVVTALAVTLVASAAVAVKLTDEPAPVSASTPSGTSAAGSVAAGVDASALKAGGAAAAAGPVAAAVPAGASRYKPNVVTILADDLDMSIVPYMRNLTKLRKRGADFKRSFVVDSLCCSSRASLMTGMYPHNSKVFINTVGLDPANPIGGHSAWVKAGNDKKSFAYAISRPQSGYRTGFFGKFLNYYRGAPGSDAPQGWSTFEGLTSNLYGMWDYNLATKVPSTGKVTSRKFGTRGSDYSTDVLTRRAAKFIRSAEKSGTPYFLELAPTSVHSRGAKKVRKDEPLFPPALRDRALKGKKAKKNPAKRYGDCGPVRCDKIDAAKLPGFNANRSASRPRYADGRPAPMFGQTAKLNKRAVNRMRRFHRDRIRMAQSLDDMIGTVMRTVGPDTYIVFTSDNGYHLGQKRLGRGKTTPYDTDIRVPLVIAGPGVARGPRYQVVQNIDLAATYEQIAGLRVDPLRDGRSLLPILRNPRAAWSRYAFVEHTRPPHRDPNDPDSESISLETPSYVAIRSADAMLARYDTRGGDPAGFVYEYYTGLSRPGAYEHTNRYNPRDPAVQALVRRLEAFPDCQGAACAALTR
ncbi:sulfatase-like hydrolase/transferase [Mumia quercus]|uniref:sulfatase-like hydrolase/transferase n=1 Tax=Mumia quercus TaxID=2976125 RepID=UPI0021CECD8E|nr:sulfatase-like hydrolase/transferase [Mumia quercus]